MNYSTAVMLINPAIRAIKGKYEENGNEETFKTLDQNIKVGDFAVVESGTRFGLTTVKITAVDVDVDFDSSKQVNWALQIIDVESHGKVRDMESQAIELIKRGELRKRREEIKKNTIDAVSAGEIGNLAIAKIGTSVEAQSE